MTTATIPVLLGSDAAFIVLFSIFVVLILGLSVIVITWAVRRDKAGRAAWRQRQTEAGAPGGPGAPAAAEGDGPPTPHR